MALETHREMRSFSRETAGRSIYSCQHSGKRLALSCSRDDYVFASVDTDSESARCQMDESFLVNVMGRLAGDKQDAHGLRVVTRVLSWKGDGLRLGADPRHSQVLISELEQDVRATARRE